MKGHLALQLKKEKEKKKKRSEVAHICVPFRWKKRGKMTLFGLEPKRAEGRKRRRKRES